MIEQERMSEEELKELALEVLRAEQTEAFWGSRARTLRRKLFLEMEGR